MKSINDSFVGTLVAGMLNNCFHVVINQLLKYIYNLENKICKMDPNSISVTLISSIKLRIKSLARVRAKISRYRSVYFLLFIDLFLDTKFVEYINRSVARKQFRILTARDCKWRRYFHSLALLWSNPVGK